MTPPAARWAQRACLTGLAVSMVSPFVMMALTPSLLKDHVILLEALTSSGVSIITGGAMAAVGDVPLLLVLLAPLCGLLLVDVFYWWAGRLWGDRVTEVLSARRPRAARWLERVESWVARHGVGVLSVTYFLPVPNTLVYATCGAAGMPLALFLLGDAIGTLLWTGLLALIGWQLGQDAVDVVDVVNRYALLVTIALVVVVVLVTVIRQRRTTITS